MGPNLRPNVDMKRAIDDLRAEIDRQQQEHKQAQSSVSSASSAVAVDDIHIDNVSGLQSIHDLGVFFSCLDPCREVLQSALGGWSPPCVIMLGAENTGKSSVLERLAMMSLFPRSDGICTRIPIRARLRRTAEADAQVLTVYNTRTQQEEKRMVIPLQSGHVDVREAMEEILRVQHGKIVGVESERIIILHVNSPSVPSIDLIDLPGIVTGAVDGEPSAMGALTRQVVLDHIKSYGDRAIYLTVSRATQATNKDVAFGLLQEHNLEVWYCMVLYNGV